MSNINSLEYRIQEIVIDRAWKLTIHMIKPVSNTDFQMKGCIEQRNQKSIIKGRTTGFYVRRNYFDAQ